MSPVGHSLVGLGISQFARCGQGRPCGVGIAGLFVAVASLPDWPLPGWGHSAYLVSHSLFVNVALIGGVYLFVHPLRRTKAIGGLWKLLVAAWLSHLLLDAMYGHGLGVAIGWPLSEFRLALPVPWLQTLDLAQSPWSDRNLSVVLLELMTFGPIALLAVLVSRCLSSHTAVDRSRTF